jgi:hypothetical protein
MASDPLADQVLYIQLLQEKNRLLRRNRQSKVDDEERTQREGGFNTYFNGGNQILAKRLEERRFLEKNRAAAAGTSEHLMTFHFHVDSIHGSSAFLLLRRFSTTTSSGAASSGPRRQWGKPQTDAGSNILSSALASPQIAPTSTIGGIAVTNKFHSTPVPSTLADAVALQASSESSNVQQMGAAKHTSARNKWAMVCKSSV